MEIMDDNGTNDLSDVFNTGDLAAARGVEWRHRVIFGRSAD